MWVKFWRTKGNIKQYCLADQRVPLPFQVRMSRQKPFIGIWLRGRPFNSLAGRGGGGYFEKKFPASACRKKQIACSTNVIESLWEKKGKNILHTRLLETKILDDQKSPPTPPQELNGRPLRQHLIMFNLWYLNDNREPYSLLCKLKKTNKVRSVSSTQNINLQHFIA